MRIDGMKILDGFMQVFHKSKNPVAESFGNAFSFLLHEHFYIIDNIIQIFGTSLIAPKMIHGLFTDVEDNIRHFIFVFFGQFSIDHNIIMHRF